jgi:hypothetical protein
LGAKEQQQPAANVKGESLPWARAYIDPGNIRGEAVRPLPGTAKEVKLIDSLLRGGGWRTTLRVHAKALEEVANEWKIRAFCT